MLTCVIRDESTGQVIGVLVLSPKVFSSGKPGYFGQAKIEIAGVKYQCHAQAVRISPKNSNGDTASE